MENNEENLGSQEPANPTNSTSSNSVKTTNTKLIGIVVVAILVILAIFFMFFTKSAKSVVKDYVKAIEKGNAKKVMATMDFEGTAAFTNIRSYSFSEGYTYDFDKFDDAYDEILDQLKDMDKDQKKEYKEVKKEAIETMQEAFDENEDDKVKYSVKDIKTEKVDGSKKLTKVTCTIVTKKDGEKDEEEATFYTMKKGFKNYIVSPLGM